MNTNNITPSGAKELPTTGSVESPIGQLRFEGGYPSKETIEKLYDQLDLQRAAQAYLDFMPAMSMQALLDMHPRDYGVSETGGIIVYTEPGEGRSKDLGLTYNTESMYASASVDLLHNGQPKPSISSAFNQPEVNPDGSVDIYFGPAAPEGKEKNWIRTGARKGPLRLDPPVRSARALLRADLET